MVYTPSIPQGTDTLSKSQAQMLANFMALNTIFANDHFTWNDATASGAYQGQHKQVTFPQVLSVDPVTIVSSSLFTKSVGSPLLAQLFFKNTGGIAEQVTFPNDLTSGQFFLPGGLIVQWGQNSTDSSGNLFFTQPFPTSCLGASITLSNADSAYHIISLNANRIVTKANSAFYYLAVGN